MPRTYPNEVLSYVTKAHAKRDEKLHQQETAEQVAKGRCVDGCGLPAVEPGGRCVTCREGRPAKTKASFVGL